MALTYNQIPRWPRVALWPGHYYRGHVTLLVGRGKIGKGQIGVDGITRVTRGWDWPSCPGSALPPAACVYVTTEDDINEDVGGRLDVSGADDRFVYDMTWDERGNPFILGPGILESVGKLQALIDRNAKCNGMVPCACGKKHTEARLPILFVVIDPLMGVLNRQSDISSNVNARKTMGPLMKLAKETGVAVLLIHHFTKDNKTIAGSAGLQQAMRMVFVVYPDELNAGEVVLHCQSANNLGNVPDLRYTVETEDGNPRINWITREEKDERATGWRYEAAAAEAGRHIVPVPDGTARAGTPAAPSVRVAAQPVLMNGGATASNRSPGGLIKATSVIGHTWELPDWRAAQ